MSVGYLLLMIGILPITVGFALLRLYGVTRLTICVFVFMFFLGVWQMDVAILYFEGVLSEDVILLLFKILRLGPTFVIPLFFYMILSMVDKKLLEGRSGWKEKLFLIVVNKWNFSLLLTWSMFVYFINLTSYGVAGLHVETTTNLSFYFPTYGPLAFLFLIHMSNYIIVIVILFYSTQYLADKYLRRFMRTFSVCSVLLFIPGLLNFNPNTGLMLSSIGIIIYTIIIFVSFIQMYNDMMKSYQQLLERQQKLDYMGTLTSTLVHEVKNSITLINGYSDFLLRNGELNKKQAEMLCFVKSGGEQLDEFVKSYASFMKSSQMTFKMTDINKVFEDIVVAYQEQYKNVDISYTCKDNIIVGYVNSSALYQVIVNLIKNSLEAMQECVHKEIKIELLVKDDQVFIDIVDSGKGITKDEIEKVFHPFYSSKQSSGLGLAFCKKIIFEHRGDINVVSSSEQGTHIGIILPQMEYSRAINL